MTYDDETTDGYIDITVSLNHPVIKIAGLDPINYSTIGDPAVWCWVMENEIDFAFRLFGDDMVSPFDWNYWSLDYIGSNFPNSDFKYVYWIDASPSSGFLKKISKRVEHDGLLRIL